MKNFEIAFKLGTKVDPSVKRSFSEATKQLSNFGNGLGNIVKSGVKLAKGISIASITAGAAIGSLVTKASETANEINKFSQVAGMSTKAFQQWDFVMKNFGYSAEQASGDLAALAEKAMDAANGVGEGAELFGMLGVKVTDASGKLKSQEQIFSEVITALQGMEDITKRNAIASALLSTTGEELVPVLNMTANELDKMKNSASVINDNDLKKADEFRTSWNQIKNTFSGVAAEMGIKAMPIVEKLINYVSDNMPAIQDMMEKGGQHLADAFEAARPVIDWIGNTGIPIAKEAILGIIDKAKTFYNFIEDNWSTIKPVVIGIVGALVILKTAMLAMSVIQTVTGFLQLFKAATIASKLSMLGLNGAMLANPMTWVIAGIMALIVAGIALYKNWDTVKVKIGEIWEAFVNVIRGPANAILGFINGIIAGFEGMVNFAGRAINKIPSIKLPDWLGGGEFGIPKIPELSLPRIPLLAEGGIATGPTLAMIGEGLEQEAVLPLSKLQALLDAPTENRSMQIVYSPQINAPEGAKKREIEEITKNEFEKFKRWMKKYLDDKDRKSL